jgi:peptide/nickel transport system substrate-binding protein
MEMNKRQLNKFLLSTGVMGVMGGPLSVTAQTAKGAGGTLNAVIHPEPPTLNIGVNQQAQTQIVGSKIFLSLLTYDFKLAPLPSLAKAWDISPDGLTYTFQLEEKVKWHDGKPVTSDDVVFTALEFLPKTHPRTKNVLARCSSIRAEGLSKVVFVLKKKFAPFLGSFDVGSFPIMPKHVYEGTDFAKNPINQKPIGCGPFKVREWVRGSHIHLEKFEGYFRPGRPYLDGIIYRVIPDGASRAIALENGQVQLTQWTDLEPFDAKRIARDPSYTTTTQGYEYYAPIMYLEMNVRNAPLNDKRFRHAISHAISRNFIRDNILHGFGRIATGPISSRTRFYDSNTRTFDHSIEKAKALLDEMGLKPDGSGIRARLRLPVAPYGDMSGRTCEYIRQSLARIGIAVQLETVDAAGWAQKISNWDYDLNLNWPWQYGDPTLGVTRLYVSSNILKVLFTNTNGYSNPNVDRLAEEAAGEMNVAKRQALFSEMQKILVEDSPMAWLVELEFPTTHAKRLTNVVTTGLGVIDSFDSVRLQH